MDESDDDDDGDAVVDTAPLLSDKVQGDEPSGLTRIFRAKAFTVIGCLVGVNIALFITLFSLDAAYPGILSPGGMLAYTYGLRHAADALQFV